MNKKIFLVIYVLLYNITILSAGEPLQIQDLEPAPYDQAVLAGYLENKKLDEASGISSSRIHNDVLWLLNDSGNKARIYAVGPDGSARGVFNIEGARNRDWEDMASFRLNNIPYLLIADTGDNNAVHKLNTLYIIKEPDVKKSIGGKNRGIKVAGKIHFVFEDGPRDCEAVAVDVAREKILLLTKRTVPPVLYELPLELNPGNNTLIAKRLTKVPTIPQPSKEEMQMERRFGIHSAWPTAMDISADGRVAVVLTYKNALLYEYNTSWAITFTQKPKHINIPLLIQSESFCFASDGRTLYLTSEKQAAPLYCIKKKK